MNYSAVPLEQDQSKDHILKIRRLSVKTPLPWLFDLAIDWAIIASVIFLASRAHSILAYVLAIIVVGNRQHALAVLAHEGTHFTVHPNKKLNDFLSDFFCFWPLLLTVDGYRRLHFTHHGNTGTSNDPELHHKKSRAPQWDLPLNGWKLTLYALKDCVGYSIPDLWIILTFSRPKTNAQLIPVAIMHLTFIVLAVGSGYWWIPLVWYTSLGTTFMLFF